MPKEPKQREPGTSFGLNARGEFRMPTTYRPEFADQRWEMRMERLRKAQEQEQEQQQELLAEADDDPVQVNRFSLREQIACVAREINLRRAVYPKRVEAGRMSVDQAAHEQLCMEQVLRTLKALIDDGK